MAKKKTSKKQPAKTASKKKATSSGSTKHATVAKPTPSLAARCPSCGASVSLDGSSVHEIVECLECASALEVVKKGSRLGLSIEHSDPGDDFPPSD